MRHPVIIFRSVDHEAKRPAFKTQRKRHTTLIETSIYTCIDTSAIKSFVNMADEYAHGFAEILLIDVFNIINYMKYTHTHIYTYNNIETRTILINKNNNNRK